MLRVEPIKTEIYRSSKDLIDFILENCGDFIKERTILAITSKIVSLSEKREVLRSSIEKAELIKRESDIYLGKAAYDCHLTLKEGLMVASAGIDESNSEENHYILYPENPFQSADRIYQEIRSRKGITEFGVLLTDSHCVPFRKGVLGAALAYQGFLGVCSQIGEKDLFGRELKMTQINNADALAAAATWTMGEGGESCPLAIIEAQEIEFALLKDNKDLHMDPKKDLFAPIFKSLDSIL